MSIESFPATGYKDMETFYKLWYSMKWVIILKKKLAS